MAQYNQGLKLGVSAIALLTAAQFASRAAMAQDGAAAPPVEQVVVTGTSIHGVAPIGSNLITVGQDDIQTVAAQDVQQLMQTIPSLSNANAITQGEIRSDYYSPSIHDLGASGSNSTLVVIDGHRAPQGDTQHSETDPNIIPVDALQRVEVLATGASSIYGSDAVAGVINFITRPEFQGVQIDGQSSFAKGYQTYSGNVLVGEEWGDGNAYLAYTHIWESPLKYKDRSYMSGNYTAEGGTNFDGYNCPSPTLQVGSNYWLGPNYTTSLNGSQANAPCNLLPSSEIAPQESRDNVMTKFNQSFGAVTLTADLIVGLRQDITVLPPGTGNVTVYGGGSGKGGQINPFFEAPAGAPTATTETARFFAAGLVPQGKTTSGSTTIASDVNANWDINDSWHAVLSNTLGKDATRVVSTGGLCSSCVNLALNGTTNAAGSLTTPSIPGTNTIVLNSPLTTANALDIWDPPGTTNKTSAAVLAGLTNSQSSNTDYNSFDQLRLVVDGTVFQLPAGPFKIAIGGEHIRWGLIQDVVSPNNTGPASTGSSFNEYHFGRTDNSAFLELSIPVISPEMHVPLARQIDVDVSGRMDYYSDVGRTSNPKFSANWEVFDGFKLFGSYSTSFVAPSLDSAGTANNPPDGHYNSGVTGVGTWGSSFNLPTAAYPGIAGVLPGCAATATSCTVGTSTVQGIEIYNGLGPALKPATGDDWNIGFDFAPDFIPGLTGNLTYWANAYKGGITSPTPSADVLSPALQSNIVVCPTSCTQAQIASRIAGTPITGALPNSAYFFIYYAQQNVINMDIQGIDFSAQYAFKTDDYGSFSLGDQFTLFTSWQEDFGGGPKFNVLNHEGLNTTFPAVDFQSRANLTWDYDNVEVNLFGNFTGGYQNWSATAANPVVNNAQGLPNGGGDIVKSNLTFDLHAAYNFTTDMFGGDQVYIDIKNLANSAPPFYNQQQGYDYFVANPIGRLWSVGLRAKF